MIELKEIKLEDKHIFDSYFSKFPPQSSELTFTNLFVWRKSKEYKYGIYKDHLVIFFQDKFLQPVGESPDKIILDLLGQYPNANIIRVNEETSNNLKEKFITEEDRDNSDYVYFVPDLIELPGRKYDAKRNFIKQFEKNKPIILSDCKIITSKCICLQEKWCNIKNCQANEGLANEDIAIKEALTNFKVLGLTSIAILINNEVEAFAIGEKLNNNTFVEHFEKANPALKGSYQYILNAFAKSIPKEFEYLNRQQDLGIEGIRKAKQSWYPHHIIKKYKIAIQKE